MQGTATTIKAKSLFYVETLPANVSKTETLNVGKRHQAREVVKALGLCSPCFCPLLPASAPWIRVSRGTNQAVHPPGARAQEANVLMLIIVWTPDQLWQSILCLRLQVASDLPTSASLVGGTAHHTLLLRVFASRDCGNDFNTCLSKVWLGKVQISTPVQWKNHSVCTTSAIDGFLFFSTWWFCQHTFVKAWLYCLKTFFLCAAGNWIQDLYTELCPPLFFYFFILR